MFRRGWSQIQFGLILALCGHGAASVLVGGPTLEYLIVFAMAFIAVGGIYQVAVRMLVTHTEGALAPFKQNYESIKLRIVGLSLDEAMARVHSLLDDASQFHCERSLATDLSKLDRLPHGLRRLYFQYESIEAQAGELRLRRSEIGDSKLLTGFTRIGTESDFREVVIRPHQEAVWIVDGSETGSADWEKHAFPSIFHYLLVQAELVEMRM